MHTERTQNAHTQTQRTTQNRTQNTTHNLSTEQHTCSAHNYRTYSLDYYYEFAYIKNSNTIELYTISKENI